MDNEKKFKKIKSIIKNVLLDAVSRVTLHDLAGFIIDFQETNRLLAFLKD